MRDRKSPQLFLAILTALVLLLIAGCGGSSSATSSATTQASTLANAVIINIGQTSEFADQLGHHAFIRQEIAPGFDGATGVVWHYMKVDPRTGLMMPGDDGGGYWCIGDPNAELFFGLTKAADGSWSSTHQEIRCHGEFDSLDITGPGYVIMPATPGSTGKVTYSQCRQPGFTWGKASCTTPEIVGWETVASVTGGGITSHQTEGPCVLNAGRCFAEESWAFSGGALTSIEIIDSGNGPGVDPRLSMTLVGRF